MRCLGVGFWEIGDVGTERFDRSCLDTLSVCGDLPVGSRFLAVHRRRVFPDGLFGDLFGGRGRPSVPASVVATVLVLQALEGLSDPGSDRAVAL